MNVKAWSPEEVAEFESLCIDAWNSSTHQGERTDAFVTGLHDARQAQRFWASDVLRDAERSGCASVLKGWAKRQRVAVSHRGKILSKPRMIGARRDDGEGNGYTEQTLFDLMTLDDLRAKRREYVTQITAYRDNIAVIDKLIALCEAAGENTPELAAHKLGTSVEAWLGKESAA